MRVIFAGTPDFAAQQLRALLLAPDIEVCAVLSQPDRPVGRSGKPVPSAVSTLAQSQQLPVFKPAKIGAKLVAMLQDYAPDFVVVAAYGKILRPQLLAVPKYACVNVHASLLPRWRGASPVAQAIAAGDIQTGISYIKMDEGLDTGPVYASYAVDISPAICTPELTAVLAELGAQYLVQTLSAIVEGAVPTPQLSTGTTFAPILTKQHAKLDFNQTARSIYNYSRAMTPWPGCVMTLGDTQLKLFDARVVANDIDNAQPHLAGAVKSIHRDYGLIVQCAENTSIAFAQVQLAGKKPMRAETFYNNNAIRALVGTVSCA